MGAALAGAAGACGASTRFLTSWGLTNSARRRRPPFGGHCRLYTAFRVSMASSTDEYCIIIIIEFRFIYCFIIFSNPEEQTHAIA